jgi:coproporphyrinogen III oxidase-like Fe-S oxidoreductase
VTPIPSGGTADPPLALYVHTPWCVKKCPYCDFNSHASSDPPFEPYVARLLADLDRDLCDPAARRAIGSIYIGGGTPSLFPGDAIRRLLDGVRARVDLAPDAEITLEANPGTRDAGRFARLLRGGGQSALDRYTEPLGEPVDRTRSHPRTGRGPRDCPLGPRRGFMNINLDMMFGLSGQDLARARQDLEELIALEPEHISYYQLTLEPNTLLHARPPPLPDPDLVADMAEQGLEQLARAGYRQYEVSATRARRCAVVTTSTTGSSATISESAPVLMGSSPAIAGHTAHGRCGAARNAAIPRPISTHRSDALISSIRVLDEDDLVLEFALNALRLTEGFARDLFTRTTGLPWSRISDIRADRRVGRDA